MSYYNYEMLFNAHMETINVVFPGNKSKLKLIDLGCLHGDYSLGFAQRGLNVLGLEVRKTNYDVCLSRDKSNIKGALNFVQDDCWNIEKYGKFDIVLCAGLLYHLENPHEYLRLLEKACSKLLIINTHFSLPDKEGKFHLSDVVEHEGLRGKWYKEFDPHITMEEREGACLSGWTNNKSFWIQKDYLINAIRKIGFDRVYEDYTGYSCEYLTEDYYNEQRSIFIGIKK